MSTLFEPQSHQPSAPSLAVAVGAVVIGRNEGERLDACLRSLIEKVQHVVYVDSGSTDGSCELARQLGAEVVSLDMSVAFTAARARNEGVAALLTADPHIEYVQVVDGDCEVIDGWIPAAVEVITANDDVAIVCGRRRERFPDDTKYNRLCDLEWDGPAGDVIACGGDALIRVSAFQHVNGFNPSLIAGEEPEMCVRLRHANYRIVRINKDMTWHDAAMSRFGQWWKRAVRAGHAYAEGHSLHGRPPESFRKREVRSIIVWGGVVPGLTALFLVPTLGLVLIPVNFLYSRLKKRVRSHRIKNGDSPANAALYASFTALGKLPQFCGLLQFQKNRLLRKKSKLIEYK